MKSWKVSLFWVCLLLSGMVFAQESNRAMYSFEHQEVGVLVLRELRIEGEMIRIRVDTGGCTTKDDVIARVETRESRGKGFPHYEITFVREVPDNCANILSEGELLGYHLRDDLHLELPCTLVVMNPVVSLPHIEVIFQELTSSEVHLKKDLIAATLWAIDAELKRYEESTRPDKAERIALLQKERERFQMMSPEEYPLSLEQPANELPKDFGVLVPPKSFEVEITAPPEGLGVLLQVSGMTRSGPFYRVAGIRGGDFSVFSPSASYRLKLYVVYKREYLPSVPSYYVYIVEWEKL